MVRASRGFTTCWREQAGSRGTAPKRIVTADDDEVALKIPVGNEIQCKGLGVRRGDCVDFHHFPPECLD
ncbi:MAG: hypothetical protein ABSC31_05925 [Acidimicrobiales bacterium]